MLRIIKKLQEYHFIMLLSSRVVDTSAARDGIPVDIMDRYSCISAYGVVDDLLMCPPVIDSPM